MTASRRSLSFAAVTIHLMSASGYPLAPSIAAGILVVILPRQQLHRERPRPSRHRHHDRDGSIASGLAFIYAVGQTIFEKPS